QRFTESHESHEQPPRPGGEEISMKSMSKFKTIAAGLAVALGAFGLSARANTTITVGDHTLDPNKAGQHVQLFAHGNDHVGGIDLYIQIDGAPNKGKDVAGPKITNLDILTG